MLSIKKVKTSEIITIKSIKIHYFLKKGSNGLNYKKKYFENIKTFRVNKC